MFCFQCGSSLPNGARFCSACGTSLASTPTTVATPSPAQVGPPPPPAYSPVPTPVYSPVPTPSYSPQPLPMSNSVLLNQSGYPQAAFERLAAAIFNALDQTISPQRTGGLEVSKMTAYRTLGGATVPPYYGEHVLPTYASVVGIELVPGQPKSAPIISWNGWHQFLLQKIKLEPDVTFLHLSRLNSAIGIPIILNRADFPMGPDPTASVKESQFKTQVYALARMGIAGGAMGGTMGMAGGLGSMGSGGQAGLKTQAAIGMAKIMTQAGVSMMNASSSGTGGQWYMQGN